MPRHVTYKIKGKMVRSRNHGRPFSEITRALISEGMRPRDAVNELQRARARMRSKNMPVSVMTAEEHEARMKYNREYMREWRRRKNGNH